MTEMLRAHGPCLPEMCTYGDMMGGAPFRYRCSPRENRTGNRATAPQLPFFRGSGHEVKALKIENNNVKTKQ